MRNVTIAGSESSSRTISTADFVMRRLLFVPDERTAVREQDVHRIFSISIVLSALRCLVTYVLLPVVSPLLGAAAGVGPAIGIPLGVVALVFDVRGVRRFWLADHRLKWPMTAVYGAVMGLVTSLVVVDIAHLVH